MNTVSPSQPGDSFTNSPSPDPAIIGLLHELVEAARTRGAVTVRLEPTDETVYVTYCIDSVSGDRDRGSSTIPKQFFNALVAQLQLRAFQWPEYQPGMFQTAARGARRIFFSAADHIPVMIDVAIDRPKTKNEPVVTLSLTNTTDHLGILDALELSVHDREALHRLGKSKAGLVIANSAPHTSELDARAIMLALAPRALYYPRITTITQLEEALGLALDNLVIIGSEIQDPIDMLAEFAGRFGTRADLVAAMTKQLRASVVHRRIKRICSACARQTHIDPHTVNTLPESLRPASSQVYMFGRGCSACGQSAYRGTTGVTSIIEINESIRTVLTARGNDHELARVAYQHGTRTLLEDGLQKIFGHLTSFEAVLAVAPRVTNAFNNAIQAAQSNSNTEFALPQPPHVNGNAKSQVHAKAKSRVMIVEDDSDQRQVLQVLFGNSGYDVVTAENGKDALEKLNKSGGADVIICDLMMPIMNGAELVKRLRSDANLAHVPVLMLTAISDSEAECKLLDNGADDYCEKRIKRKVLLKRVERLLERRAASN